MKSFRMPSMPAYELESHTANVNAIAWAPHSSKHICTAGDDKQALIWELEQPKKMTGMQYKIQNVLKSNVQIQNRILHMVQVKKLTNCNGACLIHNGLVLLTEMTCKSCGCKMAIVFLFSSFCKYQAEQCIIINSFWVDINVEFTICQYIIPFFVFIFFVGTKSQVHKAYHLIWDKCLL